MPLNLFLQDIARHPERRVDGVAVFMTGTAAGIPPALLHNLKHNRIVHKTVVLLTIITEEVPRLENEARTQIEDLSEGFFRVVARYGFMEDPDIAEILGSLNAQGFKLAPMETSYYLGRDTLLTTNVMSRNASTPTAFFGLPPNRVVELGAQIEL
jgi:KUP system potassium uptake protein